MEETDGTIGESSCPYTINPNLFNPILKYLALNASLLSLSSPSPLSAVSLITPRESGESMTGSPRMIDMEEMSWARTGGVVDSP